MNCLNRRDKWAVTATAVVAKTKYKNEILNSVENLIKKNNYKINQDEIEELKNEFCE